MYITRQRGKLLEKIRIAEILRPQGIRGELKIKADAGSADIIKSVDSVYLNGEKTPRTIKGIRVSGKYAYIYLEGVITRNDAEIVRGGGLYVPKKSIIPDAGSDVYLIEDMVGCVIVTQSGEVIGKVEDILQYGSADVITFRQENGKIAMFPFLQRVVLNVDIGQKTITADSQKLSEVLVQDD